MESKIMSSVLTSQGVTVAYAYPTPVVPTREWACVGVDPELFFPTSAAELAAAQEVCSGCAVRDVCLALGETRGESGVWGGVLLDRGGPLDGVPVIGRPRKTAA